MKNLVVVIIFLFFALNSYAEISNPEYFSSTKKDSLFVEKVFNGIKFSPGIRVTSKKNDFGTTEVFVLPEFKLGWYRKTNKIFGIHPFFNTGILSVTPIHRKSLILEPGATLALQYKFVNFRLNYSLSENLDISKLPAGARRKMETTIYTSAELGFSFNRYDLNGVFGLGYNINSYFGFYTYSGITFGVRLGDQ